MGYCRSNITSDLHFDDKHILIIIIISSSSSIVEMAKEICAPLSYTILSASHLGKKQ